MLLIDQHYIIVIDKAIIKFIMLFGLKTEIYKVIKTRQLKDINKYITIFIY